MSVSFYDQDAIEAARKRDGIDPMQIRKLRAAICKRFRDDDVIREVTPIDDLRFHWLDVVKRCDSKLDGATKLVLKTESGMLTETVILRIDTGRTSLCLSSQIGCGAACDFCATGKMGVARDLSTREILDQVVLAGQSLAAENRKPRNLVFMGMGEPFHNETQVFEAIRCLTAMDMFHHPPSRILVSSVGVIDGMVRCAEKFPEVNQALSLHSVDQAVREQIIPLAKKYPLPDLQNALQRMNAIQGRSVMIEYLMLADLNDSTNAAHALVDWLRGLDVHVNLIPYNPIEGSPHLTGSPTQTIRDFAKVLKSSGLKTTTRYSLGKDIAAACGQLVLQENRRIAQAESLAR